MTRAQTSGPTTNAASFLTDQQIMIRDLARKVATEVVAPTDLGFMGMLVPEDYGGSNAGFLG